VVDKKFLDFLSTKKIFFWCISFLFQYSYLSVIVEGVPPVVKGKSWSRSKYVDASVADK